MDREGLLNELNHYKKFSLQQFESIRLLKVEMMKIKKLAALKGEKSAKIPEFATQQDPNQIKVKDE